MASSLTFDFNGTACTPILPASQLAWKLVPVFVQAQPTQYNYILLFDFMDDIGVQRTMEMRLYIDNISIRVYDLTAQAGMTEEIDIVLSGSMYFRMLKDSNAYNVDQNGSIEVTALGAPPSADGKFSGDMVLYTAMPTINNTEPMITEPAVADTISITNGLFREIAII